MINKVKIRIPYPIKLGVFMLNRKKSIIFSFDNLSLFLFREHSNIDNEDDFKKWRESHTDFNLLVYAAYYAAESYAVSQRKEFKLNLNKFALGLAQAGKDELDKLMKAWTRSQSYGSAEIPGKKKAVGH